LINKGKKFRLDLVPNVSAEHAVHHVRVDSLTYGPYGVGRVAGRVVFVPFTAPGDEGEIAIVEEKKGYAIGTLLSLSQPSQRRCTPPCPYIPRCGGCPWQHISYQEQLKAKEQLLREHLQRIGGLSDPPLLPIIPSPNEWRYRHRLRLRFDNEKRLGFYQARSHEVVEIATCLIAEEIVSAHLSLAREWLASLRTTVRRVEIMAQGVAPRGTSPRGTSPRVLLLGNAEGSFHAADEAMSAGFLQAHPSVAGLVLFGRKWRYAWGDTRATLDLGVDGLSVRTSQGGFTQVNPAGNRELIAVLLGLGEFRSEQRVLELYCGAGNFSLPLARRVRELVGVEQNRSSVADAVENARAQGFTNCRFLCTPAQESVRTLVRQRETFEVVVLDPPRAGAAEVMTDLPRLQAQRILYVSCHPATLARDLRILIGHGYRVHRVQPLDLFPHTYHVETVAVLLLT
jgi:23S rRNA (uracil1939-C5)-methyltransferase